MSKGRVLVVDDSLSILSYFEELLTGAGYEVFTASDADHALEAVARLRPNVIVSDLVMPGSDGLELLARLREEPPPHPPVIVCSGFDACEPEAMARGAFLFVRKPVHGADLVSSVDLAIRQIRIGSEVRTRSLATRAEHRGRREALLDRVDLDQPELVARLDSVVRWVTGYFGFGTALVNVLQDSEVRIVATHGDPGLPRGGRMESQLTFCNHVVEGGASLVLSDAAMHPCFSRDPAMRAGFRFYAGAPLQSDGELTLGTLCLVDRRPHPFVAEDMGILEWIALATARPLEAAAGEPITPPFIFDIPLVLGRDLLHVLLGAELRRAARSGGALELSLIELRASDEETVHTAALELAEALRGERVAVALYGAITLAVLSSDAEPEALKAHLTAALQVVRRSAPLSGVGAVSCLVDGISAFGEHDLVRIADQARERAVAAGHGGVERVVLRRDESAAPAPSPA